MDYLQPTVRSERQTAYFDKLKKESAIRNSKLALACTLYIESKGSATVDQITNMADISANLWRTIRKEIKRLYSDRVHFNFRINKWSVVQKNSSLIE